MKYLGIAIAFITGLCTDYFADLGFWGWMIYSGLIVLAVILTMIRRPSRG